MTISLHTVEFDRKLSEVECFVPRGKFRFFVAILPFFTVSVVPLKEWEQAVLWYRSESSVSTAERLTGTNYCSNAPLHIESQSHWQPEKPAKKGEPFLKHLG